MIFIFMVFMHIVASIYLSGADQRQWWKGTYSPSRTTDDAVALTIHSIFWAFAIMLPIAYAYKFAFSWFYTIALIVNTAIYAVIVYTKKTNNKINLFLQHTAHLWQIISTYLVFTICQLLA